ncbi:unnamed protein product [Calypogeia fissa]
MGVSEQIRILKAIVPRVPLVGKTALYRLLGLSDMAKEWDLKTEITVNVVRSFIVPRPISTAQRSTLRDPGIKGNMWISKVALPAPEEDSIRQCLFHAIEALKEPGEAPGGYIKPELKPVEAEWTGYREAATKKSPELKISEAEKYEEMMKEVTSPTTILYFHGGAYYLLDPAFYRPTTSKLAKLTKGRCLSVRYRLAPQNPFPAALLDGLVCYFNLLYPPEGSLHKPVDPKHIVFSGDSAGGNLSMALLETLQQFRRMNMKIHWHGAEREVPLPAGVALISPWMDITHSSPSCDSNARYDYLPTRSAHPKGISYPPCLIWPSNPPRKTLFADDAVLCHPLVSPMAAKNWTGSPPIWIVTGSELLSDENKYVAMVAARQGVTVIVEEFEAMPHCFALILQGHESERKCFTLWTDFMITVIENPESLKTRGTLYKVKTLEEENVDVEKLVSFTDSEVRDRMRQRMGELSPQQPDPLHKS